MEWNDKKRDRATALIHEAIFGCKARLIRRTYKGTKQQNRLIVKGKDGKWNTLLPDYFNSLDALRKVFKKMDGLQRKKHYNFLIGMYGQAPIQQYGWLIPELQHIEALLNILINRCPDCRGKNCSAQSKDYHCSTCQPGDTLCNFHKPCTCNNGQVSLMKLLERDDI